MNQKTIEQEIEENDIRFFAEGENEKAINEINESKKRLIKYLKSVDNPSLSTEVPDYVL